MKKVLMLFSFAILMIAVPFVLVGCGGNRNNNDNNDNNEGDDYPPGITGTIIYSVEVTQGYRIYGVGEELNESIKMVAITYKDLATGALTTPFQSSGHLSTLRNRNVNPYTIQLLEFDTSVIANNVPMIFRFNRNGLYEPFYFTYYVDVLENFITEVDMWGSQNSFGFLFPNSFFMGDVLPDLDGMYLDALWLDGTRSEVAVTPSMMTSFDTSRVVIGRWTPINIPYSRAHAGVNINVLPTSPGEDFNRSPVSGGEGISFFWHDSLNRNVVHMPGQTVTSYSSDCFEYSFWWTIIPAGGGFTLNPDGSLLPRPIGLPALHTINAAWYTQWALDSGFYDVDVQSVTHGQRSSEVYLMLNQRATLEVVAELSYECAVRGMVRVVHRDLFFRTANNFVLFTFEIPYDDCGRVWDMFEATISTLIVAMS